MAKKTHPLDGARDAALATIQKITDRAFRLYCDLGIRVERGDVLMDLIACHFEAQKLRLDDLLAADDANFAHDIGGINKNLDRENGKLLNCFTPRFSA